MKLPVTKCNSCNRQLRIKPGNLKQKSSYTCKCGQRIILDLSGDEFVSMQSVNNLLIDFNKCETVKYSCHSCNKSITLRKINPLSADSSGEFKCFTVFNPQKVLSFKEALYSKVPFEHLILKASIDGCCTVCCMELKKAESCRFSDFDIDITTQWITLRKEVGEIACPECRNKAINMSYDFPDGFPLSQPSWKSCSICGNNRVEVEYAWGLFGYDNDWKRDKTMVEKIKKYKRYNVAVPPLHLFPDKIQQILTDECPECHQNTFIFEWHNGLSLRCPDCNEDMQISAIGPFAKPVPVTAICSK
ncbi:MAG: hypothetical protein HQK83_11735 [Fibrobacteria bacterium]|nr:hypothetical protein [Fibrobacteria bacterium]